MKFAENIFPVGTFESQKTAGAYIDETLSANLDVLARKIKDDMHFMGIITGNDSVGNGKSTLAQQVGCYLTTKINEMHGTNNTFTHKNIYFNSKDLANKSPTMPKYSVLCLDEGDDVVTHGMKDLAVRLKRYFRKCRQLNQIIILILPSFFELPKFYALARSHFLINVKFAGEYERGFFQFFSPHGKKLLYLKGKKEWDYTAHKSDFEGRFFGSYCFFPDLDHEIKLYKQNKYQDMVDDNQAREDEMTPEQIKKTFEIELFRMLHKNLPELTIKRLSEGFDISDRTGRRWLNEYILESDNIENPESGLGAENTNNLNKEGDGGVVEGEEEDEVI
jgi:hypothetical protein